MTDRLKGVTVLFDVDLREDDAQAVIDAIRMIKHVQAVGSVAADNMEDWMITERVRSAYLKKVLEIFKDKT